MPGSRRVASRRAAGSPAWPLPYSAGATAAAAGCVPEAGRDCPVAAQELACRAWRREQFAAAPCPTRPPRIHTPNLETRLLLSALWRGCLTMNTRRFEDLFYRFSLRPSLFICERFFLRSDVIRPLFKHILWRFQQIFYRTFSALHGSLRQACLILAGSGVVGSPRLLGELFPASMTLQQ